MPTTSADPAPTRSFWVPVICGAVILTIGIGARQSFGIFQKPIALDLKVGRELWSFGNALSMLLMGVLSPFVGMLMIEAATEGVLLTLGNALTGVGMAAAGFGPIFGAITRQTPAEKRSIALGVATAGGSFGQFAVVPIASLLQERLGDWHLTMLVLALGSIVMIPLTLGLREDRGGAPARPGTAPAQTSREALHEAFGSRSFWLLTFGFFVCGFHVAFVGLHLPAYISDKGVGMTALGITVSPLELGGWAIGLVGLFNIFGSLMWAWLGSRHKRKDMLALLYLLRSAVFAVFLMVPLSWVSVLAFAAALGFLWLGTVPLTSGLVGYIFGPKYMATLYGIVFFSHQVGSFLGGWGAGRLYDLRGNYDLMWAISIALGLFAALINWPIRERPVERLALQPA